MLDEREDVQKKTFTKWINARLTSPRPHAQLSIISDLYEDLRDGAHLLALLQTLTAIPLVSTSGGAVVQRVERWTLRSVGRGFKSYSGQCCVTTLGKLFTPVPLSPSSITWYCVTLFSASTFYSVAAGGGDGSAQRVFCLW